MPLLVLHFYVMSSLFLKASACYPEFLHETQVGGGAALNALGRAAQWQRALAS